MTIMNLNSYVHFSKNLKICFLHRVNNFANDALGSHDKKWEKIRRRVERIQSRHRPTPPRVVQAVQATIASFLTPTSTGQEVKAITLISRSFERKKVPEQWLPRAMMIPTQHKKVTPL